MDSNSGWERTFQRIFVRSHPDFEPYPIRSNPCASVIFNRRCAVILPQYTAVASTL